jgi:hypothetical protein
VATDPMRSAGPQAALISLCHTVRAMRVPGLDSSGKLMRSRSKRPPGLNIEVPTDSQDRLHLGRVGVVAVVGFVVGLLGPRLAGKQIAPSPPVDESESKAASLSPPPKEKPAVAKPQVPPPAPKAAPKPEDHVEIGDVQITSCRNGDGDNLRACDTIHLGTLAEGRLKALGACSAAEDAEGVLSIGLDIDFERNAVVDFKNGKSTTLPAQTARRLIDCAKKEFSSVDLAGIKHKHAQYTLFYLVTFAASKADSKPKEESSEQIISASGRATVSWHVALVREAPKDGGIVARLLSGTRVVVTGRRGDWCRIRYDAKGSEGWVYRTAIGL